MRLSLCLCLLTASAFAQKAPELGYVFPPAIPAGQKVDVQLGGYDFTPDMQFFLHDSRAKLTTDGQPGEFFIPPPPYWFGEKGRLTAFPIPREIAAVLETPQDFPPGLLHWQVANANGASKTAVVYVSDSPEILETRFRDRPQILRNLPVGVSGRLGKIAEVDRYAIVAERDGPITVELFARRLGANFNGVLQIENSAGRRLADVADTEGLDAALTFAARKNETYTIRLHDVDFRGNRAFVYRLAITPGPRVVAVSPAAGQRGQTRKVEFIGYGIASGQARLESVQRTLSFPADPQQTVMRYRLQTPHGEAPALEIPLSDLAESKTDGQAISAPAAVTGRMDDSAQATHVWTAKKGEVWSLSAQSRAIGTDLDLALSVHNAEGKQLASHDDLSGSPDSALEFKPPADGEYTCVVRDLSGRSGRLSSLYRLAIQRRLPSFALSAPQQLHSPIGGKATLAIKAVRYGGCKEEIALDVIGLPDGVTVADDIKIPAGKTKASVSFVVDAEAASVAVPIRIVGKAVVEGEKITREARAEAAGNLCPRSESEKQVSRMLLATTMKPRYSVELIDKNRQRAVHRGTTYPAPFTITRQEGFAEEIQLFMAARQGRHRQGIFGPVIAVPADADRALYPCFMPEWLETDRTTRMVVLGMAKQKDPTGRQRFVTQKADARITMILEGALLKVSQQAEEVTAVPGEMFSIPIEILRSAKLQTPVTLKLLAPEELAGLVSLSDVSELSARQNRRILRVRTIQDARLRGRWTFSIQATALQDGRWPVVSQTEVAVEFR